MENKGLYEQIGTRTGGDIYIGVVGPVRTGKSTFIKRFMECMVIPQIDNVYQRERAKDELPQSGSGRTIMTAEPKFVPEQAAEITLAPGSTCRVRLVDCVGYLVDGALGSMEEDAPRMVSTPWRDTPMSMAEAAEIGPKKSSKTTPPSVLSLRPTAHSPIFPAKAMPRSKAVSFRNCNPSASPS